MKEKHNIRSTVIRLSSCECDKSLVIVNNITGILTVTMCEQLIRIQKMSYVTFKSFENIYVNNNIYLMAIFQENQDKPVPIQNVSI